MNPMEIVVPTQDYEVPDVDTIFYVPTQKGWLINTPTLFGNARVMSDDAPAHLPEIKESFQLNDMRLPVHILTQFHEFARKNFAKTKAECSAYITYNPSTTAFKLFIPEQYVSHTSVNHKLDAGAIKAPAHAIGTIHSHCDFSAFHSSTDLHDMGKMPGLHITIGHVDEAEPEYVFALAVGGVKFDVSRENIVDEYIQYDSKGYDTAPDWWHNFIHTGNAPWGITGITTSYTKGKPNVKGFSKKRPKQSSKQTPWSNVHFSDYGWEADGYDWEDSKYRPYTQGKQQSFFEQKEQQVDAFEEHGALIDYSETTLESEAIHLALKGFHLNFSITHDPKRAKTYLSRQGIFTAEDVE